jgi:peptidoglycan/LPS O-acetylase OafA/YrhL
MIFVRVENRMYVSSSSRYIGLDLFRVVAIYGVVLYHFYSIAGSHPSLHWLIRLRDCTFPFFVISSFFVLTISFERNQERSFREFFLRRFLRIWIPFIIWTVLYLGFWNVFAPLIRREPINWHSSLAMLLSGYSHLWFLQFIFIGSLLLFPLLRFFTRNKQFYWQFSLLCFTTGLLLMFFLRPLLIDHINCGWLPQLDGNLRGFIERTINYLPYIPLAIGIGLLADEIVALYRRRLFRTLTLLAVAVWMCIYLGIPAIPFNREVYSLVVFVALLRPLAKFSFRSLCTIAEYSYAIYILHMWILLITVSVLYRAGIGKTAGIVITGSIIIFGLSLLISALLRKLFPWDWFLPSIPINCGNQHSMELRH